MSVDVRCTTRTEIGRMTQAVRELFAFKVQQKDGVGQVSEAREASKRAGLTGGRHEVDVLERLKGLLLNRI